MLSCTVPFGQFCLRRIPYGIHSAIEVFQASISTENIENLEGVRKNQNNIIIWGKTMQEDNDQVNNVMTKVESRD